MLELVGSIVSYIYPSIIGQIVVERLVKPVIGQDPDEASIQKGARRLEKGLEVLDSYIDGDSYLIGNSISLADLYLIPMWAYFLQTPEGNGGVRIPPSLGYWWAKVSERPSVVKTDAPLM